MPRVASANGAGSGNSMPMQSELVQRNREIAQIRDLLRRRELEIVDWKRRHSELLGRVSELEGRLTLTRVRSRESVEPRQEKNDEDAVGDAKLQEALERALELERRCTELKQSLELEASTHVAEAERMFQLLEEERSVAGKARKVAEAARLEVAAAEDCLAQKVAEAARLEVTAAADCEAAKAASAARVVDIEEKIAAERRVGIEKIAQLDKQLCSERQARHQMATKLADISCERDDVVRQLAVATEELKALQDVSVTQSLEAFNAQQALRGELDKVLARNAAMEDELASRPQQCTVSQLDSRVRALHAECSALRAEANGLKKERRVAAEGSAMLSEEMCTRRLDHQIEAASLRMQLEETRRARSLEMHALVTKLCGREPATTASVAAAKGG